VGLPIVLLATAVAMAIDVTCLQIICYIYFTRIIVYLLIITVSFKLSWTVDLFREVSTVVFMVITGYKFRPISNNPYLLVPNEDEEATEQESLDHA